MAKWMMVCDNDGNIQQPRKINGQENLLYSILTEYWILHRPQYTANLMITDFLLACALHKDKNVKISI